MSCIYEACRLTHGYNFAKARIPIGTHLDVQKLRQYARGKIAQEIIDFLEYGFPIGLDFSLPSHPDHDQFKHPEWEKKKTFNHGSALNHPEQVVKHIKKEMGAKTLYGPFKAKPFSYVHKAALMSREKKASILRRIISDFKFPLYASLNSMVHDNLFLGRDFKLDLPSPLDLGKLMLKAGKGCLLGSFDFESAFRQIRTDVTALPWVNFQWEEDTYTENCLVYGMKDAMFIQQSVSNTIAHVLQVHGITAIVYCDDGAVVMKPSPGKDEEFKTALDLVQSLGFRLSHHKTCFPDTKMTWIGIEFNTVTQTLSIPQEKIEATLTLVKAWQNTSAATLLEWQRLSGRLHYASTCTSGARHFTSRIYDAVKLAAKHGHAPVSSAVQQDLAWFTKFLSAFNGKHILRETEVHHELCTDASMEGAGAFTGKRALSFSIPAGIQQAANSINQREAYAVLVALRKWTHLFQGRNLHLRCDNTTTIAAIQSGKAQEPYLRRVVREIWYVVATNDINLFISHLSSKENAIADALSRGMKSQKDNEQMVRVMLENDLTLENLNWAQLAHPDITL